MTDTPFLTVADVARLVVMTEPYVRDKLSRQRGFPEPYRIGNSLRWKREDIERWIESRKLRLIEAAMVKAYKLRPPKE